MKRFHIGIPNPESLPEKPPFFFVSDCPDLHYNSGSLDCFPSPRYHAFESAQSDP